MVRDASTGLSDLRLQQCKRLVGELADGAAKPALNPPGAETTTLDIGESTVLPLAVPPCIGTQPRYVAPALAVQLILNPVSVPVKLVILISASTEPAPVRSNAP